MALRRFNPGSASLVGGDLSVDILHTEDSVRLGDGSDLLSFVDVGGVKSLPISSSVLATNSVLTGGTQISKIGDGVDPGVVEIDDVGGEKAMKVSVIATVGGGSGGTASTDEGTFTEGASQGTPMMGYYDANDSSDLADNEMGIARMTTERSLHVHQTNVISGFATSAKQDTIIGHLDGVEGLLGTIDADTGSIDTKMTTLIGHVDGIEGSVDGIEALIGTTNTTLTTIDGRVDGIETLIGTTNTTLTTIDGRVDGLETLVTATNTKLDTVITAVQLLDNSLFVDNAAYNDDTDYVNVTGGVYDSAPTALASGDAGYFLLDANHRQDVVIGAALPAGTANIGDVDVASIAAGDNNIGNVDVVTMPTVTVIGSAAHDNGSPGAPIMVAGRAANANPGAVANGDVSYIMTDLAGRVIMAKADRALTGSFVGDIATTTEETMIAQTASTFNDITQLTLTNSHATSDALVFLRDTTGGSTVWQHNIPARGGIVVHFDPPMKQTTVNTNWTIDMAVSTATIYYTGTYIQRIA